MTSEARWVVAGAILGLAIGILYSALLGTSVWLP